MTKDLTKGSPFVQILSFAFPVYLGMLFQQFYNVVDTVIVGQLLGVRALAGVGSTASLNFMVLGFCNGVCSGFAIPVAQKFGFISLCFAHPLAWLFADCFLIPAFFICLRKIRRAAGGKG